MQNFTLNNGVAIPAIGLGVFRMDDEQVARAVPTALDLGYRLIDTASRYYNEEAVGKALKASGVDRSEVFLTTKLWFKDHGYEPTKEAFEDSLRKLDTDYLDLVHHTDVVPALNQREIHPFNQQAELFAYAQEKGTLLQAWGAVGQGNQEILTHPVLLQAAEAHGKTVQQVMLRWRVQRGVAAVAKSTHPERLAVNIDVFDFELTDQEVSAIAGLDRQQPNAGFDHRDPRMFEALLSFA